MKAPKYITHQEAEKLATHTDDNQARVFIRTLYYTGARVSEILSLTHADVNVDQRTISIPHLKHSHRTTKKNAQRDKKTVTTQRPAEPLDEPPRTPRRRIPIAAALLSDLSSLLLPTSPRPGRGLKHEHQGTLTDEKTEADPGQRLFPFSRMHAFRLIREASLRSGIRTQEGKLVTPHCLRHTMAIQWIKRGGKIEQLQKFLGHSDPETTSIYLQFEPKDLADEQDRLFKE